MSYNDEEKRAFCIGYIIEHLNTLDTWDKFKNFVNGVTPEKIKTKLKTAFQNAQIQDAIDIQAAIDKEDKNAAMDSEIDNL